MTTKEKYWIFAGTPVGRSTTSLIEARRRAAYRILNNETDVLAIVRAIDEPYDWKKNYKVEGMVCKADNEIMWIPKDKKKPCWTIKRDGELKGKADRPRFM